MLPRIRAKKKAYARLSFSITVTPNIPAKKVLVVEDEELMRSILRRLLEGEGYEVATADSAESALQLFDANDFDVTVTDIKMSGMDGIDLLDRIKSLDSEALIVIITAFSSVDTAVAALRKGAYDYITKPFVNEDLLQSVKNAIAQNALFRENRALRRELNRHYNFSDVIGETGSLKEVFSIVQKVAGTNSTVLIQGESGTGKELIARALHFNSGRSAKPFLAVNCGALPESLLESELFGHTKGAFTGAVADKNGLFRSAEGGTIFLDEIGEMPLQLQVKLLRALQEHEVTPVGSSVSVEFDARILAATNKDLESEVANSNFREDLFYRLNVIEIALPPLRERPGDIRMLAKFFISKSASAQDQPPKSISEKALSSLEQYGWPGNVRELENAIERAFVLSGETIDADDLPPKIRASATTNFDDPASNRTLEDVERRHIMHILSEADGDKVQAAKALGIDLSTLYRKLKKFD